MNEVRIVGNDLIISVDEVVANMENAALIEDNKRLQAENAELRELVRDFYPFSSGRAAKPWLAVRRDRMRELGVEE